jgi:hypothetical protein
MYERFEKRMSDAMLLPLLEEGDEDDREDRSSRVASASNGASSSASAVKRLRAGSSSISVSSSRRRLRAEHERRLLRLLKDDSCRTTTDSEVTDYEYGARPHPPSGGGGIDVHGDDDDDHDHDGVGDDGDGDGDRAPARRMEWTDVLRLSAVVLVTAAAVSSYLAAIMQSLLVYAAAGSVGVAAPEWALGAAGASCLLASTLVWGGEVRLRRAASVRLGLNGLRSLALRLSHELKTLAREEEALIAEVER